MAGENPQTTLPPVPREPIINARGGMSQQWERWIQQLQRVLSFAGGVAWGIINKGDSKLSDIETRTHAMLTAIAGTGTHHISSAENVEITALNELSTGMVAKTDDAEYEPRTITGTADEVTVTDGDGVSGNPVISLVEVIKTPRSFGTETDNTTFEADGTMKYNGAATVWNDINIPLLSLRSGASVPDEWMITGTNLYISSFNGSGLIQEVHGSLEILHDYKEGTDIIPHIHWCPTTTGLGDVKWILEYSWANGGSTVTSSVTTSVTQAASGTVGHEQRTSFPAIDGTGKTIGSRFVYRLYRDPADVADTYIDDAGGFDFGIHYETDTTGSRETTTK